jgi:hypothetical protein
LNVAERTLRCAIMFVLVFWSDFNWFSIRNMWRLQKRSVWWLLSIHLSQNCNFSSWIQFCLAHWKNLYLGLTDTDLINSFSIKCLPNKLGSEARHAFSAHLVRWKGSSMKKNTISTLSSNKRTRILPR